MKITEKIALQILKWLELDGYEVIDIYEQSFRAIRKNQYILSEVNIELLTHPDNIRSDNVYQFTCWSTHVLKRYQ